MVKKGYLRASLEREAEERLMHNVVQTLAETRSAARLKAFDDKLDRPDVILDLRELQLLPLTTR